MVVLVPRGRIRIVSALTTGTSTRAPVPFPATHLSSNDVCTKGSNRYLSMMIVQRERNEDDAGGGEDRRSKKRKGKKRETDDR
jgi:hypothetical protein